MALALALALAILAGALAFDARGEESTRGRTSFAAATVQTSSSALRSVQSSDEEPGWRITATRDSTVLYAPRPPRGNGPPANIVDAYFVTERQGFAATSHGGLYRTTDAGDSWEAVYQLAGGSLFHVAFADSAHGFVLGQETCDSLRGCQGPVVLIRTADGGATWAGDPVQWPAPLGRSMPLTMAPTGAWRLEFVSPRLGFAVADGSASDTASVLRTDDGGSQWTPLRFADGFVPRDVSFRGAERGWVSGALGEEAQVRRTTDGGQTWTTVATMTGQRFARIQFLDERRGYLASFAAGRDRELGQQRLLMTDDGGRSWQQIATWPQYAVAAPHVGLIPLPPYLWFRFRDTRNGWAAVGMCQPPVGGCGGRVYRTSDGGRTWQPGPGQQLSHSVSVAGSTVWARGGEVLSRDGGSTWQPAVHPSDLQFQSLQFTDLQTGWLTTTAGVYRTSDGGASWVPQAMSAPFENASRQFVGPQSVVAYQPGAERIERDRVSWPEARLWRSDDGGRTWRSLPMPPDLGPTPALAFAGSRLGWRLRPGPALILERTEDGGQSWAPLQPGIAGLLGQVDQSVPQLLFTDEQNGLLGPVGQPARLLRTRDGGTTWGAIPTVPGAPWRTSFVPPDRLWQLGYRDLGDVAARDTLLASADGGRHWISYLDPPRNLSGMQFVSPTEGWLIDASRQKLLHTRDGGASWEQVWPRLPQDVAANRRAAPSPRTADSGSALGRALSAPPDLAMLGALGAELRPALSPTPGASFPRRVSDLTFVTPQRGFAVTADGGLYRSLDAGATWEEVLRLADGYLRQVAFVGDQVGFVIGTEGCAGYSHCVGAAVLLTTTDGGNTWSRAETQFPANLFPSPALGGGPSQGAISQLDFSFASPALGYAVPDPRVHENRSPLLQTMDGGATWQPPLWGSGRGVIGVNFLDAQHGWTWRSLGDTALLHRTIDGGQTWAEVFAGSGITIQHVQFVDEQHGYALALPPVDDRDRGTPMLLHSTDGGATWSTRYTWPAFGPSTGSQVGAYLQLRFADTERGWAIIGQIETIAAGGALWRTDDGGRSWTSMGFDAQQVRVAGSSVWARLPRTAANWAVTGYRYSPDHGRTWQPLANPADVRASALHFADARHGTVTTPLGSYATADGGASWTPVAETAVTAHGPAPLGDFYTDHTRVVVRALQFVSPLDGWLIDGEGHTFATHDGGRIWGQVWPGAR